MIALFVHGRSEAEVFTVVAGPGPDAAGADAASAGDDHRRPRNRADARSSATTASCIADLLGNRQSGECVSRNDRTAHRGARVPDLAGRRQARWPPPRTLVKSRGRAWRATKVSHGLSKWSTKAASVSWSSPMAMERSSEG